MGYLRFCYEKPFNGASASGLLCPILSKKGELEVKAVLDKDLTKMFQIIKEKYRLKTNADTVRFCIGRQYDRNVQTETQHKPHSMNRSSVT